MNIDMHIYISTVCVYIYIIYIYLYTGGLFKQIIIDPFHVLAPHEPQGKPYTGTICQHSFGCWLFHCVSFYFSIYWLGKNNPKDLMFSSVGSIWFLDLVIATWGPGTSFTLHRLGNNSVTTVAGISVLCTQISGSDTSEPSRSMKF